jgi:hypothetical protein
MSKRQSLREFEAELRARGQRPVERQKRQPLREFEAQLRRGHRDPPRPIPAHTGDTALSWTEVDAALARLEGSQVTTRIVESSDPEVLLAVMAGTLGALTDSKLPALFWPIYGMSPTGHSHEAPGIYLHPARFQGATARAGGSVLVIAQGPVLINVRRI